MKGKKRREVNLKVCYCNISRLPALLGPFGKKALFLKSSFAKEGVCRSDLPFKGAC